MKQVYEVRQSVVELLVREGHEPEFVNGGGSGSHVETAADPTVTEVGVGSAFFKTHLFDGIDNLRDFRPSLFFGLQVVRIPRPGVATCFGGGYVSSGVRAQPVPVLPGGLRATKREGFGEVQTPLKFDPRRLSLKVGDPVFCRTAKAGEPLERFASVFLLSGGSVVDEVPTYRGVGICGG
ncbi:MAG: hypothetical protein ACTSU5_19125 [Promethearchaeota archaeon]